MSRRASHDLLTPTLQEAQPIAARPPGERPWRLGSMVYVAFFGGALAIAALAWADSLRLGASATVRRWIVGLGAGGVLASVIVSYALYGNDFGSAARIGYRVVGVLTFGALYRLLRPADRLYSFRTPGPADEDYDSLWGPGVLAVFAGGAVQLGIVFGGMAIIDAVFGS